MNELVKLVQDKTGVSEQQAQTAVNTVVNYLKGKLPPQFAGYLDTAMTGNEVSTVAKDVGGLFGGGKKAG